ncbi:MAG TPA: PepSY-associated TM helix domain-containing protein [Rheinheimera sp.]|nr:PepSY-associated TM helix domain-containing protein [Rheinheimera sp.]
MLKARTLHRYLGWLIGIWLLLISLSGAVLLFKNDLLRWQYPQLQNLPLPSDISQWGPLLNQLQRQAEFRYVKYPDQDAHWLEAVTHSNQRHYYNASHTLLLTRAPRGDWIDWLYDFHLHLLAGKTGHTVLGVIGLICLVLLVAGIVQWWPKRFSRRLLALPKPALNARTLRQWHSLLALSFAPLLLLTTVTGSLMVFNAEFRSTLSVFSAAPQPALQLKTAGYQPLATTDWTAALRQAQAQWPDAQLRLSSMRTAADQPISFRARMAGEWHQNGRSVVQVDAQSSEVIYATPATALGNSAAIANSLYPLHTAAVGGVWYFWLLAVSGLLPLLLLLTGLLYTFVNRPGSRTSVPAWSRNTDSKN